MDLHEIADESNDIAEIINETFPEASEEAREEAIGRLTNILIDGMDEMYERIKQALAERGPAVIESAHTPE